VSASANYGFWFSGFTHEAEWDLPNNIVMLPAPAWGPNYANPCAAGTGCMCNAQTKIPDGAWALFAWYMFEDPAVRRAKIGWGVPGLKSHLDYMPQDVPWRKQIYDMVIWEMENSAVFKVESTPYLDRDAFPSVWAKYEEPALNGDITFDEMLVNYENEMNELIEENAAMIEG
jgi:multiple sugar transport system substrate-binding protein